MQETLQYGVTRAQESEAVNSHIICEETSKIGFFDDSVAEAHTGESTKYRRNTVRERCLSAIARDGRSSGHRAWLDATGRFRFSENSR